MDEHKQYAFLRKYGNEILLVVVNFADMPMHVGVNVPQHAFDCLQMPSLADCEAKDLLGAKTERISFMPTKAIGLDLPANGGRILKISF